MREINNPITGDALLRTLSVTQLHVVLQPIGMPIRHITAQQAMELAMTGSYEGSGRVDKRIRFMRELATPVRQAQVPRYLPKRPAPRMQQVTAASPAFIPAHELMAKRCYQR